MTVSRGYKNGGWSREGKERFVLFLKRVKRDRKSPEGIKVERNLLRKYQNVVNRNYREIQEYRRSLKKSLNVYIDYDEEVNDDDDLESIYGEDVVAQEGDDSNIPNNDSNSIQSFSTQERSQNLLSETTVFTGNAVPV